MLKNSEYFFNLCFHSYILILLRFNKLIYNKTKLENAVTIQAPIEKTRRAKFVHADRPFAYDRR